MVFRKPDIQVPYLYFDMAAAVLCASFMSFGVKRRWFSLGAAIQLAFSSYASYIGGYVHYGDWLKVPTVTNNAWSYINWWSIALNRSIFFTHGCLAVCVVFACRSGEDVLKGHGCYWSFSSAGKWSGWSVQAETTHTLTPVHWPSLLRNLFNLSGKCFFFFFKNIHHFFLLSLIRLQETAL